MEFPLPPGGRRLPLHCSGCGGGLSHRLVSENKCFIFEDYQLFNLALILQLAWLIFFLENDLSSCKMTSSDIKKAFFFLNANLIWGAKNQAWILASCRISDGEDTGTPLQYSCLENPMGGGAWWATVHGVANSRRGLSDFTFTFHFHALEKEMATHSRVLAWRIPEQGSLVGCCLCGRTESDTTEAT